MNFEKFWLSQLDLIRWIKNQIQHLNKKNNFFTWFPDGKLNIYSSCIEQHLNNKNKIKKQYIL